MNTILLSRFCPLHSNQSFCYIKVVVCHDNEADDNFDITKRWA